MGFFSGLGKFGKNLGKAMAPVAIDVAASSIPGGNRLAGTIISAVISARMKGGPPDQQAAAAINALRIALPSALPGVQDEVQFGLGMDQVTEGVKNIFMSLKEKP